MKVAILAVFLRLGPAYQCATGDASTRAVLIEQFRLLLKACIDPSIWIALAEDIDRMPALIENATAQLIEEGILLFESDKTMLILNPDWWTPLVSQGEGQQE